MNPLPSIARRGLVAAAAALALSPALASADSIVYVKDANVWLASGDGGNQYQVTTDGTAEHPYRSPSQADDGTIAVSRYDEIVRMTQNGTVLNRIDPDPLTNSVSHPIDARRSTSPSPPTARGSPTRSPATRARPVPRAARARPPRTPLPTATRCRSTAARPTSATPRG